jgi:transposase InsO family protein
MRKGVVIAAHDYGGHFAHDRTIAHTTADYWFVEMKRYVKHHIAMCVDGLTNKRPAGPKSGFLHLIPSGRRPYHIIHFDHLGPFETSTAKSKYLLVLVDNLTKYTLLYPCKITNAAAVLRVLDRFCSERGIPDRIIPDLTCFTAHAFGEFCNEREIRHTLHSKRHPQNNNQVERANRTVLTLLSVTSDNHCDWDKQLRYVENMMNTAPNKSTTKTPYETLNGYLPRFQKGILPTLSLTKNDWQDPLDIQADARRNIIYAQNAMKICYNRKRHKGIKYKFGEVVIMTRQPVPHLLAKLQPKYRVKPLQVMEVLPGDTYCVAKLAGDGHEIYTTTTHVTQLKLWKVLHDQGDDDDEDLDLSEHEREEPRHCHANSRRERSPQT